MSQSDAGPELHSLVQKARAVGETLVQTRRLLRTAVDAEDAANQRAEGQRLKAQAARQEAEAAAKQAIAAHAQADAASQQAAHARHEAEVRRQEAEAHARQAEAHARQAEAHARQAEAERQEAERQRQEAERQRHEAEARRQEAERVRADLQTTRETLDAAEATVLAALQRETLTRVDLTAALQAALVARAHDARLARQLAAAAFAARAPRPLRRRGRLTRALERLLARFGAGAQVAARAGMAGTPTLFDAQWYLARHPDVAAGGGDPLVHYLTKGAFEGRSPHPLFDEPAYRARHAHALAARGLSGLEHYLVVAANGLESPHSLFDPAWYLAQAHVPAGEDPLSHYQREGWRLGLSPHPLFDAAWYMAQAGDPPPGHSPLSHYVDAGWRAGLSPHPLIDPAWRRETYGELVDPDVEPIADILMNPARSPGPLFDTPAYVEARGEAALSAHPLIDYLTGGAWAAPAVDAATTTTAYIAARPHAVAHGRTPLDHLARQPG